MGFCLFEHPGFSNFFAVNPGYVEAVKPLKRNSYGRPVCELGLAAQTDFGPEKFEPLALGTQEQIERKLGEAGKIGLNKGQVTVLTGRDVKRPMALLLNDPGRVALVRELLPEDFIGAKDEFSTISLLYYADGKARHLVDRPGRFAFKTNAGGRVPVLDAKARKED